MTTQPSPGAPAVPELVFAQASPRSVGGTSLFESAPASSQNAQAMTSEPAVVRDAAEQLRAAGFTVLQVSSTTINIAGPPALYEQAFECRLTAEERPARKAQSADDTATFLECPESDVPGLITTSGTAFSNLLEGIGLEEPRYYFAANPLPPRAPPTGDWMFPVGCRSPRMRTWRIGTG